MLRSKLMLLVTASLLALNLAPRAQADDRDPTGMDKGTIGIVCQDGITKDEKDSTKFKELTARDGELFQSCVQAQLQKLYLVVERNKPVSKEELDRLADVARGYRTMNKLIQNNATLSNLMNGNSRPMVSTTDGRRFTFEVISE